LLLRPIFPLRISYQKADEKFEPSSAVIWQAIQKLPPLFIGSPKLLVAFLDLRIDMADLAPQLLISAALFVSGQGAPGDALTWRVKFCYIGKFDLPYSKFRVAQ
jgi:hypothetical protein